MTTLDTTTPDAAQDPLRLPEVRPRLLMMDDEPLNIQTLYRAFAADHQVFIATTGEQALALCASKHPDLVLLDVEMPGMDGYEVCRRLKADNTLRDIPVIFVTGHTDETSEARALDAGAVDFITKPISPRIVRARVKTHLTLKNQSDLLRQWVYTDGLTGVRNRRYFDERLVEEWGRTRRDRSDLSVLMLDVDFFKRFNDHDGHLACQALVERAPDLVIHWGAYLGLPQQTLRSGRLADVIDDLIALRAELRAEHGWIMDVYLLSPS